MLKYSTLYSPSEKNQELFEEQLTDYINNLKSNPFANSIENIYFQECSSSFYYGIFDSIEEDSSINFENCHFNFSNITHKGNSIFKDSKVTFKNCTFISTWNILPDVNYPNIQLIYDNCIFSDTISIENMHTYIEFNDCLFTNIELKNCNIINNLFINKKEIRHLTKLKKFKFTSILRILTLRDFEYHRTEFYKNLIINEFYINNCTFEKRFELNNYNIEKFNCTNNLFKNKFEFKNNHIVKFSIHNSNFKEIADMFASKFTQFKISKSIFNDFTGFENCTFGTSNNLIEELSEFEYVTFKDILTLRNTNFLSGLDIEKINLLNDANFLKIRVELKNTPRETFRIIKHSFDKIGNILEANKFFIKEMKKYKEELNQKPLIGNIQEKLVFNLNNIFSSFGQSYFKPLSYIVYFILLYQFILYGYEKNWLYEVYTPANQYIRIISDFFNTIIKNIQPFAQFLKKDLEFISLIFYIIFSILIWQTIVSIKRYTKR